MYILQIYLLEDFSLIILLSLETIQLNKVEYSDLARASLASKNIMIQINPCVVKKENNLDIGM